MPQWFHNMETENFELNARGINSRKEFRISTAINCSVNRNLSNLTQSGI